MALSLAKLVEGYPPPVQITAHQVKEVENSTQEQILIVLDDDPTGTQSVADLPVLTTWEAEDFSWAFSLHKPAIYVMTNSRSLAAAQAKQVNQQVVDAAYRALPVENPPQIRFVSRSDSTLRGHFPLEPFTLADQIEKHTGQKIDGIVISPAFGDAGRITVNGVHYAGSQENGFIPVSETEFAKDATFGYQHSQLAKWVAEKTSGEVEADQVLHLDLQVLRSNLKHCVKLLKQATDRQCITCDCVEESDLRLLSLALSEAEKAGKHFLYRVGPPFVRARIGQAVHPPLQAKEISYSAAAVKGGLIVIGSHVDLTTRQLNDLREHSKIVEYELEVATVLDPDRRDQHIAQLITQSCQALAEGNLIIRTSRRLVTGDDGDSSLAISRQVSAALVEAVQGIVRQITPRFVIAKGGITSSDVASQGLGIRRATVAGPMLPGIVSLWIVENGPVQAMPYVVFAGNVGDQKSLTAVVNKLSSDQ